VDTVISSLKFIGVLFSNAVQEVKKIKIYGCDILRTREEHRLRKVGMEMIRRIFGHRQRKKWETGENYIMSDFVISEIYSSARRLRWAGDENTWRSWMVGTF
jgi:hypothetical protein